MSDGAARPVIDHIGIVVADRDAAVDKLRPVFGDDVTLKELPDVGLRVAEFRTANLTVELLEYVGDARFARQVMGDRLGLNHVSTRVADVESAMAALAGKGFEPMEGFPRQGAHGRVAFFRPDETTGLLFEVCAPDTTDGDTGDGHG